MAILDIFNSTFIITLILFIVAFGGLFMYMNDRFREKNAQLTSIMHTVKEISENFEQLKSATSHTQSYVTNNPSNTIQTHILDNNSLINVSDTSVASHMSDDETDYETDDETDDETDYETDDETDDEISDEQIKTIIINSQNYNIDEDENKDVNLNEDENKDINLDIDTEIVMDNIEDKIDIIGNQSSPSLTDNQVKEKTLDMTTDISIDPLLETKPEIETENTTINSNDIPLKKMTVSDLRNLYRNKFPESSIDVSKLAKSEIIKIFSK